MPTISAIDVDRTVGQRIRALRESKGISQTTLATAIGVSFQQVQKYEKGKNRVSASRLQEIARALDVPVSVLFDEAEASGDMGEAFAFLGTTGAVDLLQAFAAIEDVGLRREVLALVRSAARIAADPVESTERG
ncbi:helix-turn-helix domain-containing protein [Methylobacterium iners]|uniref:HTH cro/C1-type domain-containing protein n=1 Tax=Methylobacterium iners TaxID=418707 RepID=A0ABQ4RXW3_9HYPH|nr:helix-turn-helix transcriptional regulator [Methylobacterium iners]GJD94544.1 hypothetical protein OCOJLMKI_1747 [Methylobacterium iners]